MNSKLEGFAQSKIMKSLQGASVKLSQSPAFSTISNGMGGTMGLIMIGAVIQIICAVGTMIFGWDVNSEIYQILYMPYKLTLGLLGFFMCFSLAFSYAKRLNVPPLQSGFTAIVCYILVCSPVVTATVGEVSFDALNLANLGSNGIFVAIIIGMLSVRITKFATEHNWVIRMPDSVPEGILNSFNSIIPSGINILIWYGLATIITKVSGGNYTLASIITNILATPMSYLVSPIGMIFILALNQLCWFFGIHGGGVVFTAIMVPYLAAFATNGQLAAEGMPLVFNPVFLYGALGFLGGTGNTLALCVLGLRSKSKQISAVSKASLVPGLFNINEPVIFGYPIMYNPILLIPFILVPIVCGIFLYIGYVTGLLALPQVLIMTALPIGMQNFMSSLDWKNVLYVVAMFPVTLLIYYPFFKVYEKQCLQKEAEEVEV